jgi:hypothetical protein
VSFLERLVDFFAAQYRWGLHPFKLVAALAAPVLVAHLADRRVRRLAAGVVGEEERIRRLPRIRRR